MIRVAVVDFVRIANEPIWRYIFQTPPPNVEFVENAPVDVVIFSDWGARHREILRRCPGALSVYYSSSHLKMQHPTQTHL